MQLTAYQRLFLGQHLKFIKVEQKRFGLINLLQGIAEKCKYWIKQQEKNVIKFGVHFRSCEQNFSELIATLDNWEEKVNVQNVIINLSIKRLKWFCGGSSYYLIQSRLDSPSINNLINYAFLTSYQHNLHYKQRVFFALTTNIVYGNYGIQASKLYEPKLHHVACAS